MDGRLQKKQVLLFMGFFTFLLLWILSPISTSSTVDREMERFLFMRELLEELHMGEIHTLWEGVVEYPSMSGEKLQDEWEDLRRFFASFHPQEVAGESLFTLHLPDGVEGMVSLHALPLKRGEYKASLIVKLEAKEPVGQDGLVTVSKILKWLEKNVPHPYIYTCLKGTGSGKLDTFRSEIVSLVTKRVNGKWGEFYEDARSWSARISGNGDAPFQLLLHEEADRGVTQVILGTPYIATEF